MLPISNDFLSGWGRKRLAPKVVASVTPKSRGRFLLPSYR